MPGLHSLCVLILLPLLSSAQEELLKNADFEDPFDDNWYCLHSACTLDHSTDAYTGQYSGLVTNKREDWGNLSQDVNLEPNKSYYFSLMVKMVEEVSGYHWHVLNVLVETDYVDGEKEYKWLARIEKFRHDNGWQLFAADFTMGEKDIVKARFYVQFSDLEVDFLVDTASLTEILPNPNWKEDANERIEQIRKSDLTIILSMESFYEPSRMEIQVEQTSHDFAFGTAIKSHFITGESDTDLLYQDFFYNNYGWSVYEYEMKWPTMEPNRILFDAFQGQINFDRVDDALDILESRGVNVRGHCVLWNMEKNQPDWLLPLEGQEFTEQMNRRLDYMATHYEGRMLHWDVNNEQLHDEYFEANTGDPDVLEHMFHEIHARDPDALLFLNDYNVVNAGSYTAEYANLAQRLLTRDVPLNGIGAQSHFWTRFPDPDLLLKRLDLAATGGVPIWVTELDVVHHDVSQRADGYEIALRTYFSHPDVHGVLSWGFWDGAMNTANASLVDGPDFEVNEAGLRYQSLVHDEWVTRFTWLPGQQEDTYDTRAFQGAYELTVLYDGEAIQSQDFYVSKGQGMTVYVDVE